MAAMKRSFRVSVREILASAPPLFGWNRSFGVFKHPAAVFSNFGHHGAAYPDAAFLNNFSLNDAANKRKCAFYMLKKI